MEKEEIIDNDVIFVAEELTEEMASILSRKVNSKDGINNLVRDVLIVKYASGQAIKTSHAIKMVLETANEIKKINELARQEYNINI